PSLPAFWRPSLTLAFLVSPPLADGNANRKRTFPACCPTNTATRFAADPQRELPTWFATSRYPQLAVTSRWSGLAPAPQAGSLSGTAEECLPDFDARPIPPRCSRRFRGPSGSRCP